MKISVVEYTGKKPGAKSLFFKSAAEKNSQLARQRTVEEHRENMLKLAELRPVLPGLCQQDVLVEGIPCQWVYKEGALSMPVILYLHGGSWAFGNLRTARPVAGMLAELTGCRVLTVQYRLAPENPFPAALEDCFKVYGNLLLRGIPGHKLAIFGDSAGGNLSLALIHRLKELEIALPQALALASPVPDLTVESALWKSGQDLLFHLYDGQPDNIFDRYVQGRDKTDPLISPVFGDLSGFPPTLIHVGGDEPLAEDCAAFARRAAVAGSEVAVKVWKEMFHDFSIVGVTLKESRDSMREMSEFLCDCLHV
ncbi:alpha/beta hydrolase [Oscillospiraceae bacterium MB08-C2-2]|nr:alpha/beta hydrolase [Oscillospiraceae bacterium MB08-C2-2]